MKKIQLLVILIIIVGTSCTKLVSIPPNPVNQIAVPAVFADSADILSAMAGIYANFSETVGGNNIFSGVLTEELSYATGEMLTTFTFFPDAFLTNTYVSTDGTVAGFWATAYSNIYNINAVITGIASSTVIGDSTKRALTGELKVLRAFNYFYLVNLFGGVPIVTSTDYKSNAVLPRSTADSVYAFIIQDLTDARNVLTPVYPSAGRARANLYTADALLARVYLYRGQYAAADAMASEVINSGLYSLTSLSGVFLAGSKEAIWQLPANGTYSQTSEGALFVPFSPYLQPFYQVTSTYVNAFEAGDQRLTNWIGVNTISGVNYYYPYKYKQRLNTGIPAEGYDAMRLAEQYLIRAEALAQQGKLDSALGDINLIRNRAGLAKATGSSMTQLMSIIMQERQAELICELGNRWFDLKRTGTIDAVLGALKPGWSSYKALLPVPSIEIQNDPFLTQNSGY